MRAYAYERKVKKKIKTKRWLYERFYPKPQEKTSCIVLIGNDGDLRRVLGSL